MLLGGYQPVLNEDIQKGTQGHSYFSGECEAVAAGIDWDEGLRWEETRWIKIGGGNILVQYTKFKNIPNA